MNKIVLFRILTFVLTRRKSYILHLHSRRIPRTVSSLSSYQIVLTAVGRREVHVVRFDFVYRSFRLLLQPSSNFLSFSLYTIFYCPLFLTHPLPTSTRVTTLVSHSTWPSRSVVTSAPSLQILYLFYET